MQNFDWTRFTKRIAVKCDITTMYSAWAKSGELERWFLSNAVYFDEYQNMIDPNSQTQTGYTYAWDWHLYPITEHGKIIEANNKDLLRFSFAEDCEVEIRLTISGDHTIVELTQKNIPTDDRSKEKIRLGCASGWAFYLVNLKSIYEGGLDLRNKTPELKHMLNM